MSDGDALLRRLPQVQRLLETDTASILCVEYGRFAVTTALREALDGMRRKILAGDCSGSPEPDVVLARTGEILTARARRRLRRTINATGIVLHTNLGRSPLAAEAIEAIADVAAGYCNLEYDFETGRRGSRTGAVEALLCEVTGAEAALLVNNGAAAILLALSGLCAGGEVVVSRGELVEIGGGFRVPDVIRQGGARLVEVGATNKTRLADYRDAIGPLTRALLKVHQSNFRTIGFVAETSISELAALGAEHQIPVVADLGSGLVADIPGRPEPTLSRSLAQGADIVTCSGDKLLGGPQAGLILGKRVLVDRLRRHPLLRALRLDKMSLAALEVTLLLHRDAPERVPVLRMIGQTETELQERAERLRHMVGDGTIIETDAYVGGGTLPEERLSSRALALVPADGPEAAAARLRQRDPPVICRIRDDRLLVDVLTIRPDELPDLATALREVLP